MNTNLPQPKFSDAAIRQFLLGRLRENDRAAFERALFLDSSLEERTRIHEIALADDYALRRLRPIELTAFVERFPFSTARRNQMEVSRALSECFAPANAYRANAPQKFEHPAWKMAFAAVILIMMFATIWVATNERRLVGRFMPHRSHPPTATAPVPGVAHHAERASERPAHREDSPQPPSHEAATNAIVLDSTSTEENAPIVMFAMVHDENLRVQLILTEATQSTYRAELTKSTGEVFFSQAEIPVDANADRVNFDIPRENLAPADFQIRLIRTSDGKQAIYFLRVR
jgi:hypothetical protein